MPDSVVPNRRQQAQVYCRRALDYYEQDNHAAAIKALGKALDLDPTLGDDPRIQRFAKELTGRSDAQSLLMLSDRTERETLASNLTKRPVKRSTILQRRLYFAGVGLLLAIFGGVSAMNQASHEISLDQSSATSTISSTAANDPRFAGLHVRIEEHHLASDPAQQYFVSIPVGYQLPTGFQVLVAVHGAGQTGEDMIRQYGDMTTLYSNSFLIAPTFDSIRVGKTDERFYESARLALLNIIGEVKAAHPISQFGQIYMGYAEGASLVTYSALHGSYDVGQGDFSNRPLAVALFNARNPLFSAPSHDLPYVLLYSSVEVESHDSLVYKKQLEQQGVKLESRKTNSADEPANIQFGVVLDFMRELYVDQYNLNYHPNHP